MQKEKITRQERQSWAGGGWTGKGRYRVGEKKQKAVGGGKNNFKILILAGRYLNVRSEEKAVRNIK